MTDFNPKGEEIYQINETPSQRKAESSTDDPQPSLLSRFIRYVTSPKFKRAARKFVLTMLEDDDHNSSDPGMQT